MIVQIKPNILTRVFNDFVGNGKTMFNFKCDGRVLKIQVVNDYTVETSYSVNSVDGDYNETDISVWVSKFIHVLSNEELVQITINEAVMFIEQSTFNCTLLREYEERRPFPIVDENNLSQISSGRLKYLAHAGVSCMGMAKELSISDPDPVFANDRYYLNYNQAAYVDGMKFPQVCIPFSTLRDFVFKLDKNTSYVYLEKEGMLYFKSGIYEFAVPTINYNINNNVIKTLDSKLAASVKVADVSFKKYKDSLGIISSAFPKQKLMFTVGTNTFGVMANSNNSNVYVGQNITDIVATCAITSAQLMTITKLFGDDESVEVRRGVGCLCLVSGERVLMIAETVY